MSHSSAAASRRSLPIAFLRPLALLALALSAGAMGCFRATGLARPDVAVEQIPAVGGDRIQGLKATAGPGDFFLGNDSVQLAIDGAVFGDREGQFGAPSGGAVLDVGVIALDQSFHRVSMPSDMLERLGPVANQDPDLPLVFDRYVSGTGVNSVHLDMQGYLLDPKGKLSAARDSQGRVAGVSVLHRISLNKADAFFTLETTLTPDAGMTLPVQSVGDFLSQHGGGFRFVVPAVLAFDGLTPVSGWGVEIPGTDFNDPLRTSVRAPMVGLMGAESAGATLDFHASLGILPLDVDAALVASDPQQALTEARPRFPGRLVVGRPVVNNLAAGQSIAYRRRLYILGGPSLSSVLPSQTTTVFNQMAQDRADLRHEGVGAIQSSSFGTAVQGGPLQTEFRFERFTYLGPNPSDPSNQLNPANWQLERVEWREPGDFLSSNGYIRTYLPALPDPNQPGFSLPYRLSARNALQSGAPIYLGTNVLDSTRSLLATSITPSSTQEWKLAEALSPERADVINPVVDSLGNIIATRQTGHAFSARQVGTTEYGGLNPLRLTFLGAGGSNPFMQRTRQLSSTYSQVLKAKTLLSTNSLGAYHYTAANQVFGTAFGNRTASSALMYFTPGDYLVHATRGPLSRLESLPIRAFDGQTDVRHEFVVMPPALPSGWTSFDLPAPSQTTTGGFNPGEMLSSALAEGVQIVARTEEDLLSDPTDLRNEFRAEIDIALVSDAERAPIGNDPFVIGARSSALGDGYVTALFTPVPTADRNGGARPSKGWTLADFITQAESGYTIVHHPAGALSDGTKGLFVARGWDSSKPFSDPVNVWWSSTGPLSLGKRQGDFDALELIRGDYSDSSGNPRPLTDGANATAWFTEFLNARRIWFGLLNQQAPGSFTKALGLSSARYSLDTPVGLARTYLNIGGATLAQADLSSVQAALQKGAAVASTGPLLDVAIGGVGSGGLVTGTNASVNLTINLYAPDWVPVDEVRVVVNGVVVTTVLRANFPAVSILDPRLRALSLTVPMPGGKDAWVVVEAGVAPGTTGAYAPVLFPEWPRIMKGIYPIAVTNPIFVDVNGGGYTPPGL